MFPTDRSALREALPPSQAAKVEDLRRALEVARLYIDAADRLMAELRRENERLRQISGPRERGMVDG